MVHPHQAGDSADSGYRLFWVYKRKCLLALEQCCLKNPQPFRARRIGNLVRPVWSWINNSSLCYQKQVSVSTRVLVISVHERLELFIYTGFAEDLKYIYV